MTQALHRVHKDTDTTARWIAFAALLVSVVAYIITVNIHGVLAYNDAISHLEIARRTLIGTSPGLAQLGGVWLPLPHILSLLLVWLDPLYYNGFAGSIVSMLAYVITVVLVYKIVYRLTGNKFAGVIGAAVFGLNINVLYMQSTPMTESLLFCLLAAMVYGVQQWADTERYRYLVFAGVSAFLATLTRYESWPILVCMLAAVALIAARQYRQPLSVKTHRARSRDRIIAFSTAGFAGIALWLVWNWVIFGNPMNFQSGDYAKPSLWLTNNEPAIGNIGVSIKTYCYAMTDNTPWPLLLSAAFGLVLLLVRGLKRQQGVNRGRILPTLALLVIVPFFMASLYTGQRPLHVTQVTGEMYNVRFGLVVALPVAILVGYAVGSFKRPRLFLGGVALTWVVLFGTLQFTTNDVATLNDPVRASTQQTNLQQNGTTDYFRTNYDNGRVLMETFGNERLAFFAVPSKELVYEGSYQQWEPALQDPASNHIRWIIARCYTGSGPDKVCQAVHAKPPTEYDLVYQTPGQGYLIYRRK